MTFHPTLQFELAAAVENLAETRRRLGDWLFEQGIVGETNGDLVSVATEFFLHVVVKAAGVGQARVVADRGPKGVRLSVTAAKPVGVVPRIDLPADPLETGSIGRRLVDGCCDELEISDADDAIGVQCWRDVQSA